MPRANRHYQAGYVWHITHRCHQREFLLKFARDRERWMYWLFESKKRYGLCVLNYIVTSNHIHLLVCDRGRGEIARSLQLIAGRVGQEYNQRKGRKGAFWEDRYHATAVDTQSYLARCMIYIDLNMVRAGVVQHPGQWVHSGFREIQNRRQRYTIIEYNALMELLGLSEVTQLHCAQEQWLEETLYDPSPPEGQHWSDSLAFGSRAFVETFGSRIGTRARQRTITNTEDGCFLREQATSYSVVF